MIKVERTIAKGKFESPRGSAAKSTTKSTTKPAADTVNTKPAKTQEKPASKAAKTVAAGKASGSGKKKTGLIIGAIAVVAICAGVGIGLLWRSGFLNSDLPANDEIEAVEEMTNLIAYDYIYPNVYIGGLDVGGMTTEEALTALQEYVSEDLSQTLWVTLSNDEVLTFDVVSQVSDTELQNLVTEAWNHGREGDAEEQAAALQAAEDGEVYTVELSLNSEPDTDNLREQVDSYAEELNQDVVQTVVAEDAVQLDETTYVMEVTKGISGVSLDADELYRTVVQAAVAGDYDPIDFEVTVTAPDDLDYETLEPFWNQDPVNASYDVETETVVEGSYGYSVSMETLAQMLEEAEEGETFQVPMTIIAPEIDKETLESRLFADVLSSKSTTYENNSNRTTNLRLACEAIDGTVLQPGEVFSFNDIVGERTAEKGYMPATVYANGGASEEQTGGGICQVASTIYYCTLYANLEVVERTEHMYRVEYIEYGLDATIYWGSLDYKFRNNTDYPIKINASVANGAVNIEFLGTKTDDTYVVMEVVQNSTTPYSVIYEVDETKPVGYAEVTQTAYTGYSYTSYRCIYDGDGNLISRTKEADSVHSKRDRIIVVGPEETVTEEPTEETPAETTETPSTEPSGTTDLPGSTEGSGGSTTDTPTPETPTTESPSTETPSTETPTTESPSTEVPSVGDAMITE